MSEQKAMLSFFLATTNILQIKYDRETNLTYIYIVENKGRTNADLVVYEFDINNVMNTSSDSIAPIDKMLEEFYFQNYITLESISNKTKIGRFNENQFERFMSFNDIYPIHNMTEVSKNIYENCIERTMLRVDDIDSDYFLNIIKSIEKDKGFDTENKTIDIELIEKNTIFKRLDKDTLDERLTLSDNFTSDLLIYEEEEAYISYQYLCEILFDEWYNLLMIED